MKLTLALLFIFGLVAFTFAAPTEHKAELEQEEDQKENDEQVVDAPADDVEESPETNEDEQNPQEDQEETDDDQSQLSTDNDETKDDQSLSTDNDETENDQDPGRRYHYSCKYIKVYGGKKCTKRGKITCCGPVYKRKKVCKKCGKYCKRHSKCWYVPKPVRKCHNKKFCYGYGSLRRCYRRSYCCNVYKKVKKCSYHKRCKTRCGPYKG